MGLGKVDKVNKVNMGKVKIIEGPNKLRIVYNNVYMILSFSIEFYKFLDKVEKEMKKIKRYAKMIEAINKENIEKLDDTQIYNKSSNFVKKVLEGMDLELYKSPYSNINENIKKILKAKNKKEFLKYLKEYKKEMRAWALEELKAFLYPEVNIDKVYKQAKGKLAYEIKCHIGEIAKVDITIKEGIGKVDKEEFLLSLGEDLKELYEENKNKKFYYCVINYFNLSC